MELEEALSKLEKIVGQDLRPMANTYNVTVFKNDKFNKGWAGHVLERHLGLGLSSVQAPNGGSWELKIVPLKYYGRELKPKETMAITMINPEHVLKHPFEESHLLSILLCARIYENPEETRSVLFSVKKANLDNPELYNQVKEDYELVRNTIASKGFEYLTGRMGKYVQPRTKGSGHGSTSRAFYARKNFLFILLGLSAFY